MITKMLHIVFCLLITVSTVFAQSLGTRANINEKKLYWELDKGFSHGVKVGMDGYFLKKFQSGGKTSVKRVAHFKVVKVFKSVSQAKVLQWYEGFFPKDAQWAQFSAKLATPGGNEKKTAPVKKITKTPAQNKRVYLDKAEEALKSQEYETAIKYYDQLLEKYPNDTNFIKKKRIAMGQYFLQQGNSDYAKGDKEGAYRLYLKSINLLDGGDLFASAQRVLELWEKNEFFYSNITQYGANAKDIFRAIIQHCNRLLDNGSTERVSLIISKIRKFASDDDARVNVDLLMEKFINKKIQSDIESKNFENVLNIIETAIQRENLYEATCLIQKITNYPLDNELNARLEKLTERLNSQKEQLQLQEVIRSKEQTIKELVEKAKKYRLTRKYDEAIQCYLDIMKIEPDNQAYLKEMKDIQLEKHNYQKKQDEIKAQLDRDSHILNAKDYFDRGMIPDALDFYIKAYNVLPEEGAAIVGIAKVLESCEPTDVKFVKTDALGKKLNIFIKDFLSYVDKTYFGSKEETGVVVLEKVFFDHQNKDFVALLDKFKKSLYETNLNKGLEAFKKAGFKGAFNFYKKARFYVITPEIEDKINVSEFCLVIKGLIDSLKKERAKAILKEEILKNKNRKEILMGLLNLSERYMENDKFNRSKFTYGLVGSHTSYVSGLEYHISNIKKKYKELKQKFKQKKKNKRK